MSGIKELFGQVGVWPVWRLNTTAAQSPSASESGTWIATCASPRIPERAQHVLGGEVIDRHCWRAGRIRRVAGLRRNRSRTGRPKPTSGTTKLICPGLM